ncbi:MAG: MerR family transcriptional regulator [Geobacteraceae bacterium]|nr:MerR family transcriptional regulator [Geobacteraceae bacterium]
MKAEVPDKQYYKIGEVARLAEVNTSVLRFWESEFAILKPLKSRTGQRLYSRQDLALVFTIKQLLYSEKMTIAGARNRLVKKPGLEDTFASPETINDKERSILREIREDLLRLRDSL